MNFNPTKFTALLVLTFLLQTGKDLQAQCTGEIITPVNASFEGASSKGVAPAGWVACQSGQSPDIQPGNFGVTLAPSQGSTYAGLYFIDTIIHPGIGTWQEGLSQELGTALVAGMKYGSSIDLSNSSTTDSGLEPGCAELEIWGGFGDCDHVQLLWNSGNITNYDSWLTYPISFVPTSNFTHISLQIKGLGCSGMPYILVDNMTDLLPEFNLEVTLSASADSVCSGTTVALTAQTTVPCSGCTYNWNIAGPSAQQIQIQPVQTETYQVTVIDSNGCISEPASIKINVYKPLSFKYSMNPVCEGDTATLILTGKGGDGNYQFTLNQMTLTGSTIKFVPQTDLVYLVTVQDGCTGFTDTIEVVVKPAPVANFEVSDLGNLNYQLIDLSTISNGAISGWNWTFDDNTTSNDMNPVHVFQVQGTHQIQLTVSSDNGCTSRIQTQTINQISRTANGNSSTSNRFQSIPVLHSSSEPTKVTMLIVYNLLGMKVGEINNPEASAVNLINGMSLPNGTYIYRTMSGKMEVETGKVQLGR